MIKLRSIKDFAALFLFCTMVPFSAIYLYITGLAYLSFTPGLLGVLTYGTFFLLIAIFFMQHRFVFGYTGFYFSCLVLYCCLNIVWHYVFGIPQLSPAIQTEAISYHLGILLKIIVFYFCGSSLNINEFFVKTVWAFWVLITGMAIFNFDSVLLQIVLPDLDGQGIYQALGDAYVLLSVFAIASVASQALTLAATVCMSLLVLFLIGSRSSLYSVLPVLLAYLVWYQITARRSYSQLLMVILQLSAVLLGVATFAVLALDVIPDNRMVAALSLENDSSWNFRAWQLQEGLAVIQENIVWGSFGSDYLLLGRNGDYIHSFLELWRQFGILPFFLFLAMVVSAALKSFSLLSAGRSTDNAIFFAFFCFLIAAVFSRSWGAPHIFLLVGLIGARYASMRGRSAHE